MASNERSVVVRIKAEVADFKRQMKEATRATDESAKATEEAARRANAAYDKQLAAAKKAGDGEAAARDKARQAAKEAADQYEHTNRRADTAMGKLVQSAREHEAAWSTAGATLMGFGAIALAGVGLAIKAYADYDKQMSVVQSATMASAAEMELLRTAAINAGADTAYSAVEAGQAVEELAKAGVSTSDILNGGLTGALSLAAAGGLEVAQAAEIAASALVQFQLSGEDIPHVADVLAAGAGKAQGSVQDLGLALSYAGVPAKGLGMSIEETAGTLSLFASNGIVGEKAGTALRGMLVSMVKPAEKTQKQMDALGISFFDASGEFIGMSGASAVLQDKLGGLDSATRNATLAQIFGNEALGAAQSLYNAGPEVVASWTKAVDDSGYAAATAAAKQNNLAGDIEKLGGSMDSVFLKSGSGANEVLRDIVQNVEGLIDWIGSLDPAVLQLGLTMIGAVGGVSLLAGGFLTLFPKAMEVRSAFQQLKVDNVGLAGGLGKTAKAAGVAAAALAVLATASAIGQANKAQVAGLEETTQAILNMNKASDASGVDKLFADIAKQGGTFTPVRDDVTSLGEAIAAVNNMDFEDGVNKWFNDVFAIPDALNPVREQLEGMDDSLSSLAQNGGMEAAAEGFSKIAKEAEAQGVSVEETAKSFPAYLNALRDLANQSGESATDAEILAWALEGVPPAGVAAAQGASDAAVGIEEIVDAAGQATVSVDDLIESMFTAGLIAMDSRDASFKYQETLRGIGEMADGVRNGLIPLGDVLNDNATDFDMTTQAGKDANDAFQSLAQDGMKKVETMAKEGVGFDELGKSLQGTHDDLVQAAIDMGVGEEAATALAREVLGVPDGVSIETWFDDQAKIAAGETKEAVEAIPLQVLVGITDNDTAATVRTKLETLHGVIQQTPDKQITITEPMSPAIITALQALGYTVTTLPDGTIQVSENGAAATGQVIDGVASKYRPATLTAQAFDDGAEAAINHIARPRDVPIRPFVAGKGGFGSFDAPGGFTGGRVHSLMGFYSGGIVPGTPPTDPRKDNVLAQVNGMPLAVRSGEWIINEQSSTKHDRLLAAINRDDPWLNQIRGFASGGRAFDYGSMPTAAARPLPSGAAAGINITMYGVPMNQMAEAGKMLRFEMTRLSHAGKYGGGRA